MSKNPSMADDFVEAATRHGEDSDPDHEVGDLQTYFREAYALLTPTQREAFLNNPLVRETYDAA